MTADIEDHDDAAHAVLVCHHDRPAHHPRAEWTYWHTVEQAREALAELTPCGRRCVGVHTVARINATERALPRANRRGPRPRQPRAHPRPTPRVGDPQPAPPPHPMA